MSSAKIKTNETSKERCLKMEIQQNKDISVVNLHSKPDFNKVLLKIKAMIENVSPKKTRSVAESLIIETDFERDRFEDKIDSHIPGQNDYGTFDDTTDYQVCRNLADRIQQCLRSARDSDLKCEILIPCDLTLRIAQDVSRMSYSEPYGLRGCVLYINLEEKNRRRKLTKLVVDRATVCTFELYLTLKEETHGWCTIQKLLYSVGKFLKSNKKWDCSPRFISPGFMLEKKKLYRSSH